ncbi:MarR family winged helix-turn-helix transcriptional regulator [Paroceanicella profunda]|uniref:MarR family winged helix-turn-helix transcriptional regulator n=1 Tax=Paroceanicella profunda TaxID=2579971 RepID=UPI001EF0288B|nr:MarR family transcriptional regulator [Paroceanicella profunda]
MPQTEDLGLKTPLDPAGRSQAKTRLRLWLRLLRATRRVEGDLRERLRLHHNTTLPRFDVLAALFRARDGLKMSDLSRMLMVSNGNVTGIVDRLVSDGLVIRVAMEGDRRAALVRLTARGESEFAEMATAHEAWLADIFSVLEEDEIAALFSPLEKLGEARA